MKKISISFIVIAVLIFIFWSLTSKHPSLVEDTSPFQESKTTSVASEEDSIIAPSSSKQIQTTEQFDDYLKKLPTIDDLQNLTEEEVHYTPEIIKEGGEVIGKIHEEAQRNPDKRVGAMSFFRKCAEDEQLAISIRAVCLHKIYKLIPEWEIPTPLSESNIPDEVLDLAMKL